MTVVRVELSPRRWVTAQLRPEEFGPVLTRLAQRDADRLRRDTAFLAKAPGLVRRLQFRPETTETWESPETTLTAGFGDCDNIGRALAALGAAKGYPSSVWVGYPEGRSTGPRHAIGVVGGKRGDLSGWSELYQAAKRGVRRVVPRLKEVSAELVDATEHPFWHWALAAAPMAVGAPPLPYPALLRILT